MPPDFIAAAHAAATALRQFAEKAHTFLDLRESLKSQNLLCTPGGWSGRLFERYISDTTGQRAALTASADDAMVSWGQVSNI